MNVFEAVKQSVTTRQAAEHYGIRVNKSGMACCPFHKDKHPSLKLDRRYYCFGCGATGDVIDFTARLYGLGTKEAARQIAQGFSILYEDREPKSRSRTKPKPPQETPEQKFKRTKHHAFRVLSDYYHLLRLWKKTHAPKTPEEDWNPRFTEALQREPHIGHLLDVLLFGTIEEQAALIIEYGKEVKNLEQRMADLAAPNKTGRDTGHRPDRAAPERP